MSETNENERINEMSTGKLSPSGALGDAGWGGWSCGRSGGEEVAADGDGSHVGGG